MFKHRNRNNHINRIAFKRQVCRVSNNINIFIGMNIYIGDIFPKIGCAGAEIDNFFIIYSHRESFFDGFFCTQAIKINMTCEK